MVVLPGEVEVGVWAAAVGQQGLGRGGRGVAAAAPPPGPAPAAAPPPGPAPQLRQLQTAHQVRPAAAVQGPQRLPRVGDDGGDLAAARPGHAQVPRDLKTGGRLKTPALE